MSYSVASTSWPEREDASVLPVLVKEGATGVDICPFRYWSCAENLRLSDVKAVRNRYGDVGLDISSLSGFVSGSESLFSMKGSSLFRNGVLRMMDLAYALGVVFLIFSAPVFLRVPEGISRHQVWEAAVAEFDYLSWEASRRGLSLSVGPLVLEEGISLLPTHEEACRLVRAVGSPRLFWHLDVGVLYRRPEKLKSAWRSRLGSAVVPLWEEANLSWVGHVQTSSYLLSGTLASLPVLDVRWPGGLSRKALAFFSRAYGANSAV